MHEELKKQYQEDVKKYGKDAYTLWEYKSTVDGSWWDCSLNGPEWRIGVGYRRKEQPFKPEYFSGLNWRDAEKLVGKVVEFSMDGESWHGPACLYKINPTITSHRYVCGENNHVYIRTCPETYAHPTVNIGGVELPRPEIIKPMAAQTYWYWTPGLPPIQSCWSDGIVDNERLTSGVLHLKECSAQAWEDWWQSTVIDKLQNP